MFYSAKIPVSASCKLTMIWQWQWCLLEQRIWQCRWEFCDVWRWKGALRIFIKKVIEATVSTMTLTDPVDARSYPRIELYPSFPCGEDHNFNVWSWWYLSSPSRIESDFIKWDSNSLNKSPTMELGETKTGETEKAEQSARIMSNNRRVSSKRAWRIHFQTCLLDASTSK